VYVSNHCLNMLYSNFYTQRHLLPDGGNAQPLGLSVLIRAMTNDL